MWRASSSATARLKATVTTFLLNSSTSKLDFVGQMSEVDLAGAGIDQLDLLAFLEFDAGLAESGRDLHRRLVVDQIAVDHRLAVGVCEDRVAEDSTVCSAGVAVRPIFTASKYSSTRRYFEM